jgi:hypothetical protein
MRLAAPFAAVALLALLAAVTPADAFTNVTVTDAGGKPLPGATVKLSSGATGQTDATGRVRLEAPPGRHDVTITSDDTVTKKATVEVAPGRDADVTVAVDRLYGWMAQTPPWGSLAVGPQYRGTWLHDMHLSKFRLTDITPGATFVADFPRDVLGDINRESEFELDMNVGGIDLAFGLPRLDLGPVTLHPALAAFLGGAHVKLDQDIPDPTLQTRLSGSGIAYGGGLELGFSFRNDSGVPEWLEDFYFRIGYHFEGGDVDLERTPRDSGLVGALGATVHSEDGSLDWWKHRVYAHAGYSLWNDRLFPYLGVQWLNTSVDLETKNRVTVPGIGSVRRIIEQEFCDEEWQGVAGLDARPFGVISPALAPLYLRTEFTFGANSFGAEVKLVYHFRDLF